MPYNDVIGSIGVGLILLAYFMNSFGLMPKDGRLFFLLNIVGAGLACYASALINYVPFIILEGVWCLVSVAGLIKLTAKNRNMFTKADIEKYFSAEKSESLLFVVIGIAAIIAAIVFFFFIKTNFYKGAAVPLLLVGLLLGVVGFAVYKRSDADRLRNVYAYDMNPQQLKDKEIPRMETVMKNFTAYRYIEIVLALLGIGLFVYFKNDESRLFLKGLGAGLALMALIALTADYFAEQRGHLYLNGLKEWVERMKV